MKPSGRTSEQRGAILTPMLVIGAIIVVLVAAVLTRASWLPLVQRGLHSSASANTNTGHDNTGHDRHDHSHDSTGHSHPPANTRQHEGHDDASAIELSAAAWKNIGLRTGIVKATTFVRKVAVPAIVVERPGRSQVEITAPFTGVVTRVYPIEGEAIQPGQSLFTLRLTHEDLVTAQRTFLQSAQELDVVQAEIARLESAGQGVIAGRRVLEQRYEQQKTAAAFHAQRQGLLLHGLSEEQIDQILRTRQLLQTLTVVAPQFIDETDHQDVEHVYHVQKINVRRGQHVIVGTPLGMLADHCLLYVEGQAFEDDAQRLTQAAQAGWTVEVSSVGEEGGQGEPEQLQVVYVADHVDDETRALRFYLTLRNQLVRNDRHDGHNFIAWKYRPGQRLEVNVPTAEPWENQLVLPVDAVVEEGAEAFVFQQNQDHFDRIAVHVLYRDKDVAVLENSAKLIGTTVAMSGAYQMHLALKNKTGGGIDAHAGHSH